MQNELEEARKTINEADAQMAELFVKRMHAVEMVFAHKKKHGLPVLDQQREDQVIASNAAFVADETLKEYYIEYLKHLMGLSRAYQYRLQREMKVACCGAADSFPHIFSGKLFPESTLVSCSNSQEAFDSVSRGTCDVAVLPIESSHTDEAEQTTDLIFSGNLFINGIYTSRDTLTRFAVLSKVMANRPAFCNSVLMFTIRTETESLDNAVRIIEKYGYQVTDLNRHAGQSYFWIEIDGSINNHNGARMLEELSQVCSNLKAAGTYAPHTEI